MTLITWTPDDCFNDFPFTIFFSVLLVGSHVDSAGLLRTLLHCWPPPAQALPGHCSLLIGPLLTSRPLIGSWPSSSAPLSSAGAGDTRLSGERGASSELWPPGLDTQLRDNNLAEWTNAHNLSS